MTPEYALHEISFNNALLYSRAVPMPGDTEDKSDKPLFDESLDACDPKNFENFEEEIDITDIS